MYNLLMRYCKRASDLAPLDASLGTSEAYQNP